MPTRHSHHDAPDTERAFLQLAHAPFGREHDLLVEDLVAAWLPMAHRLATRFRHKGVDLDDLKQVAALGLLKAVEHYEPERGAFESYAVPTISGELRRYFRDCTWAVHVPRRVQDLRNTVRDARRQLLDQPGHCQEPDVATVAEWAGLSLEEARAGWEALESYSSLSLDCEGPSQTGFTLADALGDTEDAYGLITDREAAKIGLRKLPERERTILYLRYFEDMTQSRIAEKLGISQMHVSRLLAHSCAQVRAEADHGRPE
ncbi:sigma-70 family RNA polymerase sigma factor [Streptomyces sp. NPDC001661]